MDPVAHTLVGAAVAETGLSRRSALATATLIIGANLPDADAVLYFVGSDLSLAHRRGHTHGILAMLLLPLLLTAAMSFWYRSVSLTRSSPSPPFATRWIALCACVSVWSHPLLDWLNTYGVRLLMPFDSRWFYGDVLFIVDPWLWLLLGGLVLVARRPGRTLTVALALFSVFATLLLFSSPELPAGVRLLWLVGLAIAVVGRRLGPKSEPARRRLARVVLSVALLYVLGMLAGARLARSLVGQELAARGLEVERLMVGPLPATPFDREVVAETPQGYRVGAFRWLEQPHLEIDEETLPLLAEPPEGSPLAAALHADCVRGFVTWARFPFAVVEETERGTSVQLMDARYVRRPGRGFGSARVEVTPDLEPACPEDASP